MNSEKYIPGFWDGNGAPRADILARWPSRTADHTQRVYDYDGMRSGAFADRCIAAGVEQTRRQFRKWERGIGAARTAAA